MNSLYNYVYRTVAHSDLNGFYAAVECLMNPKIRHLPVAVCGDKALRHGIVLAKNPVAKQYGVKTGETIGEALKKCPSLVIVSPNMELYEEFSRLIRAIYEEYSDNIAAFGSDECWLDITKLVKTEWEGRIIADEIREKIKEQTGLTCSVGVSFNRTFSKVASDLYKVDATMVVTRENYKDTVWTLPADNLMGIGNGAKRIFKVMNIATIGDIAKTPVELLEKIFGKVGRYMHRYATGEENASVHHKDYIEEIKSIGNIETTPRDMMNIDDVKKVIYMLSENVAYRLRKHNLKCRTVKLYIRENDLKFCHRQGKLDVPRFVAYNIAEKGVEVFKNRYDFKKPLRSIGIHAVDLVPDTVGIQSSLFDDTELDDKREKVARTVDRLRDMYGFGIVKPAVMLEDKALTHVPDDYNRSEYRVGSAFGSS